MEEEAPMSVNTCWQLFRAVHTNVTQEDSFGDVSVGHDPPSLMALSNHSEDVFADDASDSDVTRDFESLTYVSCDDCERERSPSPQKISGPKFQCQ